MNNKLIEICKLPEQLKQIRLKLEIKKSLLEDIQLKHLCLIIVK